MFSGIIEELGTVSSLEKDGGNIKMGIRTPFINELKIDQSVAHNGVCLTVVDIQNEVYYVDIIEETLRVSNLSDLNEGDEINLERSLRLNDRLDGHIVQGHVDQTAELKALTQNEGSWTYTFSFTEKPKHLLINKGSVCINGVSLTISSLENDAFQVSIIPYTHEHTNFKSLKVGSKVNVEFDVLGKYVERLNNQ